MRRVSLAILLVMLLSVSAFAASGATGLAYDLDGDKIFENLNAKIENVGDDVEKNVIVVFNEEFNPKAIEAIIGAFDLKYEYKNIEAFAGTLNKGQITALSNMPMVKHIQLDAKVKAFNDTATHWFGADAVNTDFGYDGTGVTVAVIDTGIDAGHVDLDGGKVVYFKDWVNGNTTAYDDNGHGTHCAGTIAGTGEGNSAHKGVAPGADLIGLKVLDSQGSGSMSDIDAAIEWCINNKDTHNIDVLSMSLGSSGSSDGTDTTSQLVDQAFASGLVPVVAAGNDGPTKYTVGSPGAAADALTVGAMVDTGENGYVQAYFSSRGPTADERVKPDISAPGWYIMSTQHNTTNGYTEMSGTSMATPYTAGTVALMLEANPALTPTDIKSIVMNTAVDFGHTGTDIDFGAGRLQTYEAVKSAANLTGNAAPAQPDHLVQTGSLATAGEFVEYTFNVDTLDFPIGVNLIMDNWEATGFWIWLESNYDFDLYLYDPAGNQVDLSEKDERQDEITFTPTTTGTYTVKIQSTKSGGNYTLDISY